MNYVLDLGFVAFESWWQVSAAASVFALYIIFNVIPAVMMFFACITDKDTLLEMPLTVLLILIPILGSIMGAVVWNEDKRVERIALLLTYLFIISVIGIGFEQL